MEFFLNRLYKLVLLFSLSFNFIGCSGDNSEVIAPPSVGSGGGGAGLLLTSGFWVDSSNSEFPTYVNSENGFGTNCLIDSNAPFGTLSCYVDVMELDLYNNEIVLQYNVAPDMCQHVSIRPAWHWNFSSGLGPSNITIQATATDAGEVIDTCSATRGDGAGTENCTPGVNEHPEILGFNESGVPNCAYNHSLRDSALPNCCLGSYTITKNLDSDNNGSYETITVENYDWGGSVTNCIGGPIRTGTGVTNESGYPVNELIQVPADGGSGLNEEVTITSNSSSIMSSFSYPANFYTTDGNPHAHSGFSSPVVSNLPYAVNPVDDLDGSRFNSSELRPGLPAYTFTCLDEADDVKYAMFVFIREWNTVGEFFAYGSSDGVNYNPDLDGTEGSECPGIGNSCNDFLDFDDLLNNAGGTYDTGPTADYMDRNSYFPELTY